MGAYCSSGPKLIHFAEEFKKPCDYLARRIIARPVEKPLEQSSILPEPTGRGRTAAGEEMT